GSGWWTIAILSSSVIARTTSRARSAGDFDVFSHGQLAARAGELTEASAAPATTVRQTPTSTILPRDSTAVTLASVPGAPGARARAARGPRSPRPPARRSRGWAAGPGRAP